MPITQRIETNGTCLQLYEHSQSGEPLLFLHPGVQAGSVFFAPILQNFIQEYRVLTVDLRGHGQSEWSADGYEIENMAEDLVGVLDALGLQSLHIVGNSLGADVALRFAAAHPTRVRSLVSIDACMLNLVGPDGELDETKEELINRMMVHPRTDYESYEEFYEDERSNWLPWNEHKEQVTRQTVLRTLENGRLSNAVERKVDMQILASLADSALQDVYPKIKCPVLFLPATNEPKFLKKIEFIQRNRSILPQHRIVVIPDTHHMMMTDHPCELSNAIRYFLDEVH